MIDDMTHLIVDGIRSSGRDTLTAREVADRIIPQARKLVPGVSDAELHPVLYKAATQVLMDQQLDLEEMRALFVQAKAMGAVSDDRVDDILKRL